MANILDSLISNQQGFQQALTGIAQQTFELTADQSTNADKTLAATARVDKQKKLDEIDAITNGKHIAAALGADPNSANYRMDKLAAEKASATDEAIAATQEYQQLTSTSFFENPLAFIVNQFKADSVGATANSALHRANIASQEIATINADVQSGMETARQVNRTVSEQYTADQLELTATASKTAADEVKLKGLAANTHVIKALEEGNNATISAIAHQQSMALQMQDQAMQRANFAAGIAERNYQHGRDKIMDARYEQQFNAKEQHKATAEQLAADRFDLSKDNSEWSHTTDVLKRIDMLDKEADALDAKSKIAGNPEARLQFQREALAKRDAAALERINSKKATLAGVVTPYRLAIAKLGYPEQLPDDDAAAYAILKDQAKKKPGAYAALEAVARANSFAPDAPIILGTDAAEVIKNKALLTTYKLPEAMEVVSKNIHSVAQANLTIAKPGTPAAITDKTKPEQIGALLNQEALKLYDVHASNADTSPIFQTPKLPELVNIGKIRDTGFFKKYLAPEIAEGNSDSSVPFITGKVIQAISEGAIKQSDATKLLTDFYSNVVQANNLSRNFIGQGLPNQSSYSVPFESGSSSIFGSKSIEPIDMTNPAQVSRMLTKMLVSSSVTKDAMPLGRFGVGNIYEEGKDILKNFQGAK